jgi:hypothetical protein
MADCRKRNGFTVAISPVNFFKFYGITHVKSWVMYPLPTGVSKETGTTLLKLRVFKCQTGGTKWPCTFGSNLNMYIPSMTALCKKLVQPYRQAEGGGGPLRMNFRSFDGRPWDNSLWWLIRFSIPEDNINNIHDYPLFLM